MDLTHEQDSGPGSEDVDDVVTDHPGQRLHTTFRPQPLVAGVLLVLQLEVVGAVRGLWSSAGETFSAGVAVCDGSELRGRF